jgi:hypothetical protein
VPVTGDPTPAGRAGGDGVGVEDGLPAALIDPVGTVVVLVTAAEPALDRQAIAEVVTAVAAGRVKQRRLAQALQQRPEVLLDGRSPAPRVVGDLLGALRGAGAVLVSPPVCAQCGKRLRTFARRGQDWYCQVCFSPRQPCAVCGKTRAVSGQDRDGRPLCRQCPADDGADPTQIIVDAVLGADPGLPAELVAAAVERAAPRGSQRRRLAWALSEDPGLLTGAGARAGVPSVLRLIDELCDAGATGIIRPACPSCHRVVPLTKTREGLRVCGNCSARARPTEPCQRCGKERAVAARDEQGRPTCARCLVVDPVNQETCHGCGRTRPVCVRTPDGPLCWTCRPLTVATCSICGRRAPCAVSQTTGRPWCAACKQRWARCARCGHTRPVRGGTAQQPLCATCTRDEPGFWRRCPGCGQPGRLQAGPCPRCALQHRLNGLLAEPDGQIRSDLQALYQALLATERPGTVTAWLDKSSAPAFLRDLRAGDRALTHQALDELPAGATVEHLRAVLVAVGTLPARDERMTRLERWTTQAIAQRPDPSERELLHRYAVWHIQHRLRRRPADSGTTQWQAGDARRRIRAAIALLDWLAAHNLTLATATQADLDTWQTSARPAQRHDTGHFVRWARKHKLTRLDFAAPARWEGPAGPIEADTRWAHARRLLHDDTLGADDRVAGLLVLLYAQTAASISRLTLDHVQATDQDVRLRLGPEPVLLPEPLAGLVRHVVDTRHGHAAVAGHSPSPWLFPGGRPGHPISAGRMTERLRQLGIRCGQARSAALFQLATELPAALLARMLGIHIVGAVAWQRACAGDWTTYAAHLARRPHARPEDIRPG